MKRTELRRKTPLRRSTTPTKRTPIRAVSKKKAPGLDGHERSHVLNRDRKCVIRIFVDDLHWLTEAEVRPCADEWAQPISAWTFETLTYQHVKPAASMGGPRPQNRRWGVAACHSCNAFTHQVSKYAGLIRDYLADLEATGRL